MRGSHDLHRRVLPRAAATGKMSLLDLAGSEKVSPESVQGHTAQAEARDTAASLQAVGEVLWAVLNKDPQVPYNDHVITKVRARVGPGLP